MSDAEYKSPLIVGVLYGLAILAIGISALLFLAERYESAGPILLAALLMLSVAYISSVVTRTHWRVEQIAAQVEELDTERIVRARDQRAAKLGK